MKLPLAISLAAVVAITCSAQLAPSSKTPAAPVPTIPIESMPARPVLSRATAEKIAAMKPIFDGKTLDGWIQAPDAPIRFATEDVKDFSALAKRLTVKADPVSAWLAAQLDEAGVRALAADTKTPTDLRVAVSAVLKTINRVVGENVSVYDAMRFQGVALRAETVALRQQSPTGLQLARLNRLLLEDAFPTELAKSPATSWIVKDGAMVSTGACRGSIYTKQDYAHYRLVFQVRQISGNHVPGALIFCARPPTRGDIAEAEAGIAALGAIQFQVPNGGHWDYRPGVNQAGQFFTRPIRVRFNLNDWSQVEILVNARTGVARMAVAQPVGTRAIENLVFIDPAAGKPGPIAWQMHNAGLFDEYKDVRIEVDPTEERLITLD